MTVAGLSLTTASPAFASNKIIVKIDSLNWEWDPVFSFSLKSSAAGDYTPTRYCTVQADSTANAGPVALCDFELPTWGWARFGLGDATKTDPYSGTAYLQEGVSGQELVFAGTNTLFGMGDVRLDRNYPSKVDGMEYGLTKHDGFYELKFFLTEPAPEPVALVNLREVVEDGAAGTVCDGGDSYGDRATAITGTDGDDVVCVTAGEEPVTVDTGDGDDVVVVVSDDPDATVVVDTGAGDDVVIVDGPGDVTIVTGDGDDAVSTTSTEADVDTGDGDDVVLAPTVDDGPQVLAIRIG